MEGWELSAQAGMGTCREEPQAGLAHSEVEQRWAKVLETEAEGRHGPSEALPGLHFRTPNNRSQLHIFFYHHKLVAKLVLWMH